MKPVRVSSQRKLGRVVDEPALVKEEGGNRSASPDSDLYYGDLSRVRTH